MKTQIAKGSIVVNPKYIILAGATPYSSRPLADPLLNDKWQVYLKMYPGGRDGDDVIFGDYDTEEEANLMLLFIQEQIRKYR